jgi:hypothetical protein
MEAASIGYLGRTHNLDWVVAKGVMDFADFRKDDRYKPFAARASAEALLEFLISRYGKTIDKGGVTEEHPPQSLLGKLARKAWVVAAMIAGLGVAAWFLADSRAEARFDAIYDQTFSSDTTASALKSAHNTLLNVIPQNISGKNGPEQWSAVSRLLARDVPLLDNAYKELDFCVGSKECSPGRRASSLCSRVKAERSAYNHILAELSVVPGINLNRSDSEAITGDAFGADVRLPNMVYSGRILKSVCGFDIAQDPEFASLMTAAKKRQQQQQSICSG